MKLSIEEVLKLNEENLYDYFKGYGRYHLKQEQGKV